MHYSVHAYDEGMGRGSVFSDVKEAGVYGGFVLAGQLGFSWLHSRCCVCFCLHIKVLRRMCESGLVGRIYNQSLITLHILCMIVSISKHG